MYVSAPSNSATHNIAKRAQEMADMVSRQIRDGAPESRILDIMVVHGYSIELGRDACMELLQGKTFDDNALTPWNFPLSLAYWVLTAHGAKLDGITVPSVSMQTSGTLRDLHWAINRLMYESDVYSDDDKGDYVDLIKIAQCARTVDEYLGKSGNLSRSNRGL